MKFYGSVPIISGSINLNGSPIIPIPSGVISGSEQVNQLLPDGTVSGSSQIIYSGLTGIPSGIVSGSIQIDITQTTGYSTFSSSVASDTINKLYQPDKTNAFVYTDNSGNLNIDGNIYQNGVLLSQSGNSIIIRNEETKIGVITLFQLEYDLYRIVLDIPNIPTELNNESTFTLSSIPLGFNLYLKADALVVAQDYSQTTTDFFNSHYEITRLWVDSDLSTKITIKCISSVNVNVNASIQLEYVKDFGEVLELSITVPEEITPTDVNLTFPKLKYNKSNVASITVDDSYSIWNNLFSVCNKKWVDDEYMSFFTPGDDRDFDYHRNFSYLGYTKTTGHYPSKFIEYTDGAGVKHRYAVSVGVWGWKLDTGIEQPSVLYPWVEKEELKYMEEFGCSTMFHDLQDLTGTTSVTQSVFNLAVKKDSDLIYSYTGRRPKVMIVPNGDANYIVLGWGSPNIQYQIDITDREGSQSTIDYLYPFSGTTLINKKSLKNIIKRDFWAADSYEVSDFQDAITANAALPENERKWLIYGLHRPSREAGFETFFNNLETLYGVNGDDSLWFPSVDEFLEYWFMTKYGLSSRSINGQEITFKIYVPCNRNFWFKSISCLLSGINSISGVTVTSSDNCYGTSYAINGTSLLVNLDFDSNLITKAEKYVSILENNPGLEYAYDDAVYFVQQIKDGLKEPFQSRIEAVVTTPLTLSGLTINNGASITNSPNVTIGFTYTGIPTHYMLSESSDFTGASWVEFTENPLYTLSEGYEIKTIYGKLKNLTTESTSVVNDSIEYAYLEDVSLTSIIINSGDSSTESRNITIGLTLTGPPTEYRVGETSTLSGVTWIEYTGNTITYQMSETTGVKTIYVQIQNPLSISSIVSDSIILEEPIVGAVCSFIGELNNISYPTVGETTLNVFSPAAIHESWGRLQLKSKSGNDLQWFYEKNASHYQANYTTTDPGTNLSTISSSTDTGNSGPYPDTYLAQSQILNGTGNNGAYKGRMAFTLPVGTYKFQFIMSVSAGYALEYNYEDDALYRVDVNGVEGTPVAAGVLGFTGVNNSNFNAETTFTVGTAGNGNVNLYIYNNINWGYRPGVNLIEITKLS